jgi:ParB-like chromosome segregation protein Spo0J
MSQPMQSQKDQYPCLAIMKAGDIKRAEWNPRVLPERNEGKAGESLEHFGWLQPITWNAKTKTLIDGHMRLEDVSDEDEVPVYCVWLDEDKEQVASVALNNNYGDWQDEGVSESLKMLNEEMAKIEMAGFGNETGKYLFLDEWEKEEKEIEEELDEYEKKHKIILNWEGLDQKIAWEQFMQRAGTIDAILESMKGWINER